MLYRLQRTVPLVEVYWCLLFLCPHADRQLKCLPLLFSGMSFCAREAHAEAKGRSVTVHDMCAEKPRRFVPKQEHVMAAWRVHEAVGVVSPTVRARPHRESCLFGDDVVDATHIVWLVVASFVSANISVLGVVCFQSREAIFRSMCLRDCSADATRGFAMAAIGLFHVEVVT